MHLNGLALTPAVERNPAGEVVDCVDRLTVMLDQQAELVANEFPGEAVSAHT